MTLVSDFMVSPSVKLQLGEKNTVILHIIGTNYTNSPDCQSMPITSKQQQANGLIQMKSMGDALISVWATITKTID